MLVINIYHTDVCLLCFDIWLKLGIIVAFSYPAVVVLHLQISVTFTCFLYFT